MVGQALYRLVFFDFLFLMLGSFFGEFLRKWVFFLFYFLKLTKCSLFLFYVLRSDDIVVSLLQPDWAKASAGFGRSGVRRGPKCLRAHLRSDFGLVWAAPLSSTSHQEPTLSRPDFLSFAILRIGIYFSPLLPVIQILKCFIFFYVKKVNPRPYPFQPA